MSRSNRIVERYDGELSVDQRRYRRLDTLLSACLVDSSMRHDCAVLDLSVSGARLQFDRPPEVVEHKPPGEVSDSSGRRIHLRLASKLSFAGLVELPIEAVWHKDAVLGVRFLAEPTEIAKAFEGLLPGDCLVP